MTKELVLVTGVTGFVGTAVARAFIDQGYTVRGTSRSQSKIDLWSKFNPQYVDNIEWVIVKDGGVPNAFNESVKGVDYIAHTASPFHFDVKDNEKDMLLPAVEGTKNILAAANKEPKVKHLIITSSFAAVTDLSKGTAIGKTYSRDDWNPATWEDAVKSDNPGFVYCASKAFAEKAAWDDKERQFPITAICPPTIFGPAHQPVDRMSNLNTSIASVYSLLQNGDNGKVSGTSFPVGVDVRDVAAMHVAPLHHPAPTNPERAQRFLMVAWHYYNHEWLDFISHSATLKKLDANIETRLPGDRTQDPPYEHFLTDSGAAEQFLGRPFIDKETCMVDTVVRLLELEKTLST